MTKAAKLVYEGFTVNETRIDTYEEKAREIVRGREKERGVRGVETNVTQTVFDLCRLQFLTVIMS